MSTVISVLGVLSKDAKEGLCRSWEEQHSGLGNVRRTVVQNATWRTVEMQDAKLIRSLVSLIERARDAHLAECPVTDTMEEHLARAIHDAGWRPT
jgi:hypothetical protein